MASLFSPIQTPSRRPNSDPQTSRGLLAGLSGVPCAAVAAPWRIGAATSGFIGLDIAGLGAAVIAVANILNVEVLSRALGPALVAVLTVVVTAVLTAVAFAVSAVWRNRPCLNPAYPMAGFWERCDAVEERAVEEKRRPSEAAATISEKAAVPNGATFDPRAFSALIPFAGLKDRRHPAAAVTATTMTAAPVQIRKAGLVNPAVLEVWILR